ncbi:hypothetical protein B4113_1253 [Geobacillus sp. B4113_201601]|nr:hypothetical protein B4113_1253 [Geobacillus sp. B4113_201601]
MLHSVPPYSILSSSLSLLKLYHKKMLHRYFQLQDGIPA